MTAGDAATERTTFADQVRLANEFVQAAWAHPGGEGLPLGRGLEEGLGARADRTSWGRHGADGSATGEWDLDSRPVRSAGADAAARQMLTTGALGGLPDPRSGPAHAPKHGTRLGLVLIVPKQGRDRD